MPAARRPRILVARLAALSAAVGAAALVGLGSTPADATPTTTATSTTTATTTEASTTTPTTTTPTTTTPTTETPTTETPTTTVTSTTAAPTTTGSSTPAPGPQCAGKASVLTPVLCIPTGSGEDQPAPIGTDGELEFAAQVVNNGPGVSDATVEITLPPGLQFDPDSDGPVSRLDQWWTDDSDDDGTALDCITNQDGSTDCSTGAVAAGANFLVLVDVAIQGDPVAGTSGTLEVTLEPTPPDTVPMTVQATVDFVGTAHLQVHLTPSKASVTVNNSLTLVATVHNVGPNDAVEAAGIGIVSSESVFSQPFLITNSTPLTDEEAGSGTTSGSGFLLRALSAGTAGHRTLATRRFATPSSAAQTPGPVGFWPIATIAAGKTATVTVVVKAESVGQAELDFLAGSADESCDDPSTPGCENTAAADLTAVAATTTTTTTAPPTTATSGPVASTATAVVVSASGSSAAPGTAALPNTGFEPMPWVGSAGAAILLGVGLMLLGAPRRRLRGQHR